MTDDENNKPIKIAGLWKAQTKSGLNYLNGPLGEMATLAVFPNKFKQDAKHPDYFLTIAPKCKRREER
jgi:hypothetical protein